MMRNEKTVKKLLLILLVLCVSMAGALIWTNGGYKKGGLLRLGKRHEISCIMLDNSTKTMLYDEETGNYATQEAGEAIYFNVDAPKTKWKYCVIKLSELNQPHIVWEINLLNAKEKSLFKERYVLYEGTNRLKISANGKVKDIRIGIYNQQGYTFKIDSITLQEKYFDVEDFLEKTVVLMLVWVMVYILASALKRMDWYFGIEFLQNVYKKLGDFLGRRISFLLMDKLRDKLLVICFMLMFLLMPVMNVVSGASYAASANYWIYGYGILMVLSGVLSWTKPLRKLDWKNGICLIWFLLWSVVSLSDLLVMKSFAYLGHIMVLCGGFAFFVWNNEKCFKQVLRSMCRALHLTFIPILMYCILFRPKKEGIFYNGCFLQHESMAMYMLAVLLAFLLELKYLFRQKKLNSVKIIVCGVAGLVSISLLYYSRTDYCILAMLVAIVIWGIEQVIYCYKHKTKFLKIAILASVVCVLAIPSVWAVKRTIEVLPVKQGCEIVYPNEEKESVFPNISTQEEEKGIVANDEESREDVWRSYVEKINLIGNNDNLRIEEKYINPVNGILQMAHRYGIFVLIPYIAILLFSIYTAITEKNFRWCLIVLTFVILLVGENIEMPFTQPLWLLFYLGMGQWFGNKEKEDTRLEITYENCD